jgi:hypothetical protein
MLYRIKDFEQVYNISENKFKHREEDFLIKRTIDEVVDIARSEIQKKSMELTLSHGDIPNQSKGD